MKKKLLGLASISSLFFNSMAVATPYNLRCIQAVDEILYKIQRPTPLKGVYADLRSIESSAEQLGSHKKKLLKKIEYWTNFASRDIKISELRKIEMQSFLLQSLRIDTPQRTVAELRYLFFSVEEAYFSILFKEKQIGILKAWHSMLKNAAKSEEALALIKTRVEGQLRYGSFAPEFLNKLRNARTIEDAKIMVANEIISFEDRIIANAYEIHRSIDEYATAKKVLEKALKDTDKHIAENAKTVTFKLQSEFNLRDLGRRYGLGQIKTPQVSEIYALIEKRPISELLSLKQEVRMERASALIGSLPDKKIHEFIDTLLSKISWANTPEMRAYFRRVIEEKNKLVYYPLVDRIVMSDGKLIDKLKILKEMDSQITSSQLLSIFARRSDVVEEWRRIHDFSKQRAATMLARYGENDADVIFFKKIQEANLTLKELGPLPPWHVPHNAQYFRVVIDGIFLTGGSYAVYRLGSWASKNVLPNGESQVTPVLIDSKPAMPMPVSTASNGPGILPTAIPTPPPMPSVSAAPSSTVPLLPSTPLKPTDGPLKEQDILNTTEQILSDKNDAGLGVDTGNQSNPTTLPDNTDPFAQ